MGQAYGQGVGSFDLPSSLLALAAIVPATRLRQGTGVALLSAWQPLRLACAVALLDQISAGRLVLRVGIGTPAFRRRFGVSGERMADLADELLQALQDSPGSAPEVGESRTDNAR